MSEETNVQTNNKLCECDCGQIVSGKSYWKYGKKHYSRYISGHNQRGKHGGTWKEHHGRTKKNEYWYILKREHHFCDSAGYFLEHRLVYEEYYKCVLMPWADVHHIDGNPENNDILNLYACMHSEHTLLENNKTGRLKPFPKGTIPWNKGLPAWNKGKPWSEEVRKRISLARKGKPHPHKGRK